MKEHYKLIKIYPGSPELGFILKPCLEQDDDLEEYYLPNDEAVEPWKYPEFWEKVVKKDYKILSFGFRGGLDRILRDDKYYLIQPNYTDYGFSLETMLNLIGSTNYYIKSIKRLSDGEIFTIGDTFQNDFNNASKIKSIKIINNIVYLQYYSKDLYGCKLSNAKKIKQSLLTTEDGVEIFEGDYYYKIFIDKNPWREPFTITKVKPIHLELSSKIIKRFSTKEKAEEYILMNKPCLSLKEVLNICTFLDRSKKKLEELVKSKL